MSFIWWFCTFKCIYIRIYSPSVFIKATLCIFYMVQLISYTFNFEVFCQHILFTVASHKILCPTICMIRKEKVAQKQISKPSQHIEYSHYSILSIPHQLSKQSWFQKTAVHFIKIEKCCAHCHTIWKMTKAHPWHSGHTKKCIKHIWYESFTGTRYNLGSYLTKWLLSRWWHSQKWCSRNLQKA